MVYEKFDVLTGPWFIIQTKKLCTDPILLLFRTKISVAGLAFAQARSRNVEFFHMFASFFLLFSVWCLTYSVKSFDKDLPFPKMVLVRKSELTTFLFVFLPGFSKSPSCSALHRLLL